MSDHVFDWARAARTGAPEAILAAGKTDAQLAAIVAEVIAAGRRVLITRLDPAPAAALAARFGAAVTPDPASRTAVVGTGSEAGAGGPEAPRAGAVCVVAAGTSDLAVAREAVATLAFHGHAATLVADVGVAGLWRLLARIEEIRRARVVIAVAGMEGALFSVLGGLVAAPVVAVPSSVGYGVSAGGQAALSSALSTCAPGVVTVNIDNGFGAAIAALRMLAAGDPGRP